MSVMSPSVRPVLSCSIPPRPVVYLTNCLTRMRGAVHYISSTFCQSSYFAIDQSLLFTWKILIYFQVNILFVTFEYCAVYVRGINNAVLVFYMIVLNGTTGYSFWDHMPKSVPFCDVNDTLHSINSLCISMTVRAYVIHYISSTFCQSSYFAIDQSLLFTWKILIYFQPIESSVNKHE